MEELFNQFLDILTESIEAVEDAYFNFKVAGNEESIAIKRERVYCGDLYVQMRNRSSESPYYINPEPNKIKHPHIEEPCGPVDPDFIVHKPGFMEADSNLVVIEVKHTAGDLTDGLIKDVKTINCMTTIPNGYYGGIIIIFGELTLLKQTNLINRIKENKSEKTKRLVLMLHKDVGSKPEMMEL